VLTAKFAVKLCHAFDPVKAGRPTSSRAVELSLKLSPNTADWWYTEPLDENMELESIGNSSDYRMGKVGISEW